MVRRKDVRVQLFLSPAIFLKALGLKETRV